MECLLDRSRLGLHRRLRSCDGRGVCASAAGLAGGEVLQQCQETELDFEESADEVRFERSAGQGARPASTRILDC